MQHKPPPPRPLRRAPPSTAARTHPYPRRVPATSSSFAASSSARLCLYEAPRPRSHRPRRPHYTVFHRSNCSLHVNSSTRGQPPEQPSSTALFVRRPFIHGDAIASSDQEPPQRHRPSTSSTRRTACTSKSSSNHPPLPPPQSPSIHDVANAAHDEALRLLQSCHHVFVAHSSTNDSAVLRTLAPSLQRAALVSSTSPRHPLQHQAPTHSFNRSALPTTATASHKLHPHRVFDGARLVFDGAPPRRDLHRHGHPLRLPPRLRSSSSPLEHRRTSRAARRPHQLRASSSPPVHSIRALILHDIPPPTEASSSSFQANVVHHRLHPSSPTTTSPPRPTSPSSMLDSTPPSTPRAASPTSTPALALLWSPRANKAANHSCKPQKLQPSPAKAAPNPAPSEASPLQSSPRARSGPSPEAPSPPI